MEECNYDTKKTTMENLIIDQLDSSLSDDETDGETESDNEVYQWIWERVTCWNLRQYFNNNKSLIVHANHALLHFYLCQPRRYSNIHFVWYAEN